MLIARGEVTVISVEFHAHHTGFGAHLFRVAIPGADSLADLLIQAVAHPPEDSLIQQRRHQQVAIPLKCVPLWGP
jgi:hypothetical protein